MLDGINDLELECIENAIVLETPNIHEFDGDTVNIKVNIPKLMPLTKIEEPNKNLVVLNRNILLNDPDSIKSTDYRLYYTNYLEVPTNKDTAKKLSEGDTVLILIPNKNIKNMRIL